MIKPPDTSVLVVDDDPSCCQSMVEPLQRAGYHVESTTDALAAYRQAVSGHYSLVVTDLRMPNMCGTQLLEDIRQVHPTMPALLVSAFPDRQALACARQLGVRVLPKPFSSAVFLAAVTALLSSADEAAEP
ncbi:MAG TPA: response regulator [Candidatus Acidoferrales bacterium]|nr:response regulator [Candidatus Acidoferrales bacterium]